MYEERQRELLRDREVTRYEVLEHAQPALKDLARLAAGVTGMPVVMTNLVVADRQATVAAVGLRPSVCSRKDSMCSTTGGR